MKQEVASAPPPLPEQTGAYTWHNVAQDMPNWPEGLQEHAKKWLDQQGVAYDEAQAIEHQAPVSPEAQETITHEHHETHVEMARDVDPEIDERPPEQQDMIGKVMELGDEAVSGGRMRQMFNRFRKTDSDKAVERRFRNIPEKDKVAGEDPIESLIGFGMSLSMKGELLSKKSYWLLENRIKAERDRAAMSLSFMNRNNTADKARALKDVDALARLQEAFAGVKFKEPNEKKDSHGTRLDFVGSLASSEITAKAMIDLSVEAKNDGRRSVPLRLLTPAALHETSISSPVLSTVYRIGKEIEGDNPVKWIDSPTLDPSLKTFFEDNPEPLKTALFLGEAVIPGEGAYRRMYRISRMENSVLMEKLALPPPMVADLKLSLAHFSGNFNPKDPQKHFSKLSLVAERAADYERALKLYETFGLVNLDRYSDFQLNRMYNLALGKPKIIAALQEAPDLQLAITDRTTDHNNAFASVATAFEAESKHGPLLVAEASHPAGYYRVMSHLKRLGVLPTTVIIGAHGHPGSFSLGGNFVELTADSNQKLPSYGFDISKSHIGRLVEDYMRPGSSGEKNAVFLSCSLAKPGKEGSVSLVEKVAEMTDAVTWGGDKPLNIQYEEKTKKGKIHGELRFVEINNGEAKPMPVQRFRRSRNNSMVHKQRDTVNFNEGVRRKAA